MTSIDRFFALSTCVHCRHTRELFEENKVAVTPIYVDKLQGDERQVTLAEMKKYNPQLSFPTLVFSTGNVVIGFQPNLIKKELEL